MEDCLFCKIISGEIPSTNVYEDDQIYAFKDINPQAPVHVLFVPKTHIASFDEITEENSKIAADIAVAVSKAAKELKLENGYRVVTNIGQDGAQSVKHLHFHLLGGRQLSGEMA